jgi:hypothetical protein
MSLQLLSVNYQFQLKFKNNTIGYSYYKFQWITSDIKFCRTCSYIYLKLENKYILINAKYTECTRTASPEKKGVFG